VYGVYTTGSFDEAVGGVGYRWPAESNLRGTTRASQRSDDRKTGVDADSESARTMF
jgi:hypothetical protein